MTSPAHADANPAQKAANVSAMPDDLPSRALLRRNRRWDHGATTGQVVHLGGSIAWQFSWKQAIDSSGAGHGGQGITWSVSPTGAPILTDGRTAYSAGLSWYDFPSLAAAQATSTRRLLENLGLTAAAGAVAEPSRTHTIAALKPRTPGFSVQARVAATASRGRSDGLRTVDPEAVRERCYSIVTCSTMPSAACGAPSLSGRTDGMKQTKT